MSEQIRIGNYNSPSIVGLNDRYSSLDFFYRAFVVVQLDLIPGHEMARPTATTDQIVGLKGRGND